MGKEDETNFCCSNLEHEGKVWHVYTTQRRMITKLKKNPYFRKSRDIMQEGFVIGIEGTLPYPAISLRKVLKNLPPDSVFEGKQEGKG